MSQVLSISNLELSFKTYEGFIKILHGIDLSISKKERVALVGESGSGKSVLANIICGLINQKDAKIVGKAQIFGKNFLFNQINRDISIIFQDPMNSLNPYFTIQKQLLEVALKGIFNHKKEALSEIKQLLNSVGITEVERILHSYPFELSGGLNQRIIIAMALINKPKLVVADEPSTALDVSIQNLALKLMKKLTESIESSVLLISHDLGMVREFADRVYVIYKGHIVETGSNEVIFNAPKHIYTQTLLDSIPKILQKTLPKVSDSIDFLSQAAVIRDLEDKVL